VKLSLKTVSTINWGKILMNPKELGENPPHYIGEEKIDRKAKLSPKSVPTICWEKILQLTRKS
jgi:hypothetical protein